MQPFQRFPEGVTCRAGAKWDSKGRVATDNDKASVASTLVRTTRGGQRIVISDGAEKLELIGSARAAWLGSALQLYRVQTSPWLAWSHMDGPQASYALPFFEA